MKHNNHISKTCVIAICILSYGCFASPNLEATQGINNQVETKIAITEPATNHITPTTTSIMTTEIPTLPYDEAREQSTFLLQNNNNCRLSCWWGITPGTTTWQDILKILAPLSMSGNLFSPIAEDGIVYVNPPTPTDEHGKVLFQTYYFEDGIVKSIEVYNFDFAPFTYFKKIIAEYGIPDEMYIRGHRDTGFRLALFYPNQGILAEYSRTITSSDEKNVRICYEEANSPFLYLWESNHPMTFEDAIVSLHIPTEDIPSFINANDALTNFNEFMSSLASAEESCIETQKDLWPPQY